MHPTNQPFILHWVVTIVCRHRLRGRREWVALFIKEACEIIKQFRCILNDSFEFIAVEIVIKKWKNIVIGSVYRPSSGDLDLYNENFECLYWVPSQEKQRYYILVGNYNINLLLLLSLSFVCFSSRQHEACRLNIVNYVLSGIAHSLAQKLLC